MDDKNYKGSRAILRAFDILDLLKENPSGMMLSDISKALGFPKSTTHRILQALIERQMVRPTNDSGHYSLGYGVLTLSRAFMDGFNLVREARPILESINQTLGEIVHLGALDASRKWVVYLDKVDASQPLRVYSRVGKVVPVHCTALGKALLSCLSPHDLKSALENYEYRMMTPNTITSGEVFFAELLETRSRGYAVDRQEYDLDMLCVAAPIINKTNHPLAAVSVSAPRYRFDEQKMAHAVDVIKNEVKRISALFENVSITEAL